MKDDNTNKNKNAITYIIIVIVIILLSLLGGYLLGKHITLKNVGEPVIEYVQLPSIHDTITEFKPKYIPADTANIIETCIAKGLYIELFPWKTDTIFTSKDTTLILADWASRREYSETLFNIDTIGKLNINIGVQYNRLDTLSYVFNPIQKQTTTSVILERKFEPFLGGGLSVGIDKNKFATPGIDAELGAFINQHHGVVLEYQYMFGTIQNHIVTAKYIYKF